MDLKIAAMNAKEEDLTEETAKKIGEEFEKTMPYYQNQAEYNKAVADFHGISVVDYINSPNMDKLKGDFFSRDIKRMLDIYQQQGFSDKLAWYMVMSQFAPEKLEEF